MPDFHDTGFDPFEHIIKLTHIVNNLTDAHNRLAESHINLEKEVSRCRREIHELKKFLNLVQQ